MSGFSELGRIGVTFRPIDQWPAEVTRHRRRAPFNASLSSSTNLLARELRALSARLIVLQIAITEDDLRIDGLPRSTARASHPGVILAFESKFGPLKFSVDTFTTWEDNIRAIALGMEALRKVDRYGVTKRGEQYTGWKALPMSTDAATSITNAEQARVYLDERWGGDLRRALMETHPDRGGDSDEFRKVIRARELVEA
jgi:hypothetical protein